jgi:hypothetical protein
VGFLLLIYSALFLVASVFCFAVGKFAESKGRNGGGWLVLSMVINVLWAFLAGGFFLWAIIGPLMSFFLIAVGADYRKPEQKALDSRRKATQVCPFCAETIRAKRSSASIAAPTCGRIRRPAIPSAASFATSDRPTRRQRFRTPQPVTNCAAKRWMARSSD